MALTNKLTAIADAIRSKTGGNSPLTLDQMVIEIESIEVGTGGGSGESGECNRLHLPEEALIVSGSCGYRFANNGWNWFLEEYADKIVTTDVTNCESMFYNSSNLTEIPFDINLSSGCYGFSNMFDNCTSLTTVPLIKGQIDNPSGGTTMNRLFSYCSNLREIPHDYFYNFASEDFWEIEKTRSGNRNYMFYYCYSLRKLPDISMLKTSVSYLSCLYYYLTNYCYALDEITNLPVLNGATYSSNMFTYTVYNCYRLQNFTFAIQEDGTPYKVEWKNQTLDLSSYVGYAGSSSSVKNILNYNSGITSDKEVTDDATYQALKDDPDWYTASIYYSRYNHDSAVATINSLPDASAYLNSAGGKNTIKFKKGCGQKTDGGMITNLTTEEIAVATAKGWTVSLVS